MTEYSSAEIEVSVLMSVYREPLDLLLRSVESILQQKGCVFELVFVLDEPARIAEIQMFLSELKSDQVRLVVNSSNLGLGLSLNRGVDECKGRYIARADADDFSVPDRLNKQLEFIRRHDLDIVGSGMRKCDGNSSFLGEMMNAELPSPELCKRALTHKSPMFHPTWFGRREVFEKIKYRDFKYAQDIDFLVRALDADFQIGNVQKLLVNYTIPSLCKPNYTKMIRQMNYVTLANKRSYTNEELAAIHTFEPSIFFKRSVDMLNYYLSGGAFRHTALVFGFILHSYVRRIVLGELAEVIRRN